MTRIKQSTRGANKRKTPVYTDRKSTEKSAATYKKIINAAVDCLAKYGYYSTNMIKVAEAADVTRGCLLYYFPTLSDLLRATIEFIIETVRERQDAVRDIASFPERFDSLMQRLKRRRETGYIVAWVELIAAARTDKTLRPLVMRGAEELDDARLRAQRLLFPDNTNIDRKEFRVGADAWKLYLLSIMFADILFPKDTEPRIQDVVDMWKDGFLNHLGFVGENDEDGAIQGRSTASNLRVMIPKKSAR